MCDCFETVEKNLRKKTGDPLASLVYMYAIPDFKKMPVVEALYRTKKKDGTFSSKETSINIAYGFCPFCGTSLYNDKNNKKEES